MKTAIVSIACGVLFGCGSDESVREIQHGEAPGIESTTAELSFREHCDTAAPDATIASGPTGSGGVPGLPNAVSSPTTYDSSGCNKAYLVNVWVAPGPGGDVNAFWNGSSATTPEACETTQLLMYWWDTRPEPPVAMGSSQARGTWDTQASLCVHPRLETHIPGDSVYRFAVSARKLNPTGGYGLRSVSLHVFGTPGGGTVGTGGSTGR